MIVQHNLMAMNSNRMLGKTTKSQGKATERLSSGFKINRAADDASGLAISTVIGVMNQCAFVRVHQVRENRRVIQMTEAIMGR